MIDRLRRSYRMHLVLVLFLCGAVRLACLLFYPLDPAAEIVDPDDWNAVAINLVQGRGYTLYAPQAGVYDWDLTRTERVYRPTMRVPPVYPVVLAALYWLTGVRLWAGQLLQILFDMGTAWMIYRIGLSLFDRRIGLLAALGWALYAPEATHVLKLRSEPLFTLLLCVWVWVEIGRWNEGVRGWGGEEKKKSNTVAHTHFLISSSLLALLALCRPSMGVFAGVFGFYAAVVYRRISPLLVLLIVIGLWLIRSVWLFGIPAPIATNGGYSLYRSVFTIAEPTYITQAPPDFEAAYATFKGALHRQGVTRLPRNEAELDRLFRDQAWNLIRDHPIRYVHLCAENVMRLWFRIYGGTLAGWKDWVTCLINAGLLLFAGVGLRRTGIRPAALPLALIGFNTVFYAMTLADPRYNTPIIPFVLIWSACGVLRVHRKPDTSGE